MKRIAVAGRLSTDVFDVTTASQARFTVEAGAYNRPGRAAGPAPMELLIAGLATCAASTLEAFLTKMRFPVDDLRVLVDADREERSPRGWTAAHLTYQVVIDAPSDRLRRAVELTERACPASVMLAKAMPIASSVIQVRRVEASVTRPLRQRILRPHQSLDELVVAGEDDPKAAWFAALANDEVVATAGVTPERSPDHPEDPRSFRLRSMATDEAHRRIGLGGLLLDACLRHAAASGASRVWCSARTPARPFYEGRGFEATTDVYEVEHIGPHVRMDRLLGE